MTENPDYKYIFDMFKIIITNKFTLEDLETIKTFTNDSFKDYSLVSVNIFKKNISK